MSTNKRVLYVGGLDEGVTETLLHDAFIPFGEIKSVEIPQDYTCKKYYPSSYYERVIIKTNVIL